MRPSEAQRLVGRDARRQQVHAAVLAHEIEAMSPGFETVQGVSDLGAEFASADLALIAFGVTAYELAALGVPALYLALSADHAILSVRFLSGFSIPKTIARAGTDPCPFRLLLAVAKIMGQRPDA